MSLIEESMVSAVINDAPIAALIGNRMRPELPADADLYPCIVYEKEDDEPRVVLGGKIKLTHARFNFECWADSYATAKDLRTRLKNLLQAFAATVLGVSIRLLTIHESADLLEAAVGRERVRRFGVGIAIDAHYRE